ncbi:28S ribosomal protein S18b, mitochondrial [Cataglyphis hispanica]|uniref:28S ribosomal protein S18b, mitochondrial n=1 Tax=Cataglyphis hispanica TaxID=1086592 RepID=UPI00217FC16F|nr:28S ribosomal protein S18b, mitochondrial [Cataglyphis hispanica]
MLILNAIHRIGTLARGNLTHKLDSARSIISSCSRYSDDKKEEITTESERSTVCTSKGACRPIVSVETSIKYMDSDAYKQTYGDNPVWKLYRRNYKGQRAPRKTRKTCVRGGIISTGNPCPICRDEYLIFDHRNVKLLKQFISEYNGETLSYLQTSICQKRHKELLIALINAKNYGTITFDVPIRQYNYFEWKQDK